jgi:hypothetical protein
LEDEKMIVAMEVEGRPALVAYLNDNREPVSEDLATLIEVHFTDEGNGTIWLVPEAHAQPKG